MSTTASAPLHIDTTPTAPIPFSRLVRVEWRKMFDTRGGLWLILSTAIAILGILGLMVLVATLEPDLTLTFGAFTQGITIGLSLLLPVFAIVSVTGEWGQRTALVTFALEPSRPRVLAAKLVAVTALALLTIVIALVAASAINGLYGMTQDAGPAWNLDRQDVLFLVLNQLLYFWMAFALACLLISTAGTIVVYYIFALFLPVMVYSALVPLFDWAANIVPWVDIGYALMPLTESPENLALLGLQTEVNGTVIGQIVTSLVLWIVIPGVLGAMRVVRSEVK